MSAADQPPKAPSPWRVSHKYDRFGAKLADGHYSRRKIGSPQFMPPGETLVLVTEDERAVFGWWRPHPRSGLKAMNGFDAWTCSIFHYAAGRYGRASQMVLAAESELAAYANDNWEPSKACGPDGLLTYVHPKKIRSSNPGYCFKVAGWIKHPVRPKSSKGLPLLWKPLELAGIQASGIPRVFFPEEARHAA